MVYVPLNVITSRRDFVLGVPPFFVMVTVMLRITLPEDGIVGRPSTIGMTRLLVVSLASRVALKLTLSWTPDVDSCASAVPLIVHSVFPGARPDTVRSLT